MRAKICGMTNLDDAALAVDLGAWAVGVVLYGESPRSCPVERAAEIGAALKRRSEVAGVFVNESLDRLVALAEACELTMVQLHGDEGPAYCAEAARRTGAKVIKAVRVKDRSSLAALTAYSADYFLLDSHSRAVRGGSGETFDWSLVAGRRLKAPVILSGGLTPANVAEAVEVVAPYAVDVASGVEAEPGRKDPDKVRAFLGAVRGAGAPAASRQGAGEGREAP